MEEVEASMVASAEFSMETSTNSTEVASIEVYIEFHGIIASICSPFIFNQSGRRTHRIRFPVGTEASMEVLVALMEVPEASMEAVEAFTE